MLTSLSPLQPLLPQIQTPFVLTCSHCVLPSWPLHELLPRPRTPSPPPPFAAYCYLLQHNKSTKFSSLKHKCLLSHSFCVGQEPGKSSPGRFWRRVSHKVTIKLLTVAAVIWRLASEWRIHFQNTRSDGSRSLFLATYWQRPQCLVMWASPHGCLSVPATHQLISRKEVTQERAKQKPAVFYDLVLGRSIITLAIFFHLKISH